MQSEGLTALERVGYRGPRPAEDVAADLEAFRLLLIKWQRVQNLVSRETLNAFWSRHIIDSLQLLDHLPIKSGVIIDIGSGGGFPALPMAIALKGSDTAFRLVDSNGRKCSFLRTVARELGLSVKVFDQRIDSDVSRETGPADVITARALAPLPLLFSYAARYWGPETVGLFHKGREHGEEIKESDAEWSFDMLTYPSIVDQAAAILEVRNLRSKDGI